MGPPPSQREGPAKLILDVDTGTDDAVALTLAAPPLGWSSPAASRGSTPDVHCY
jgi:hypothetical protein